ncbi:MAG: dTDP-4-dehydrorhamnose reductase [Gammaproteobacteria bacterium]|nr:dTDP-4-dehydrorhamnose reductase [Gammaproteobacteria bacterium]
MTKSIVVTGSNGQFGATIANLCKAREHPANLEVQVLDRAALDITQPDIVNKVLDELQPDVIINAAAYTQVDKAEAEEAEAHAVNATGAANVARWVAANKARLIHISTDFVFAGNNSRPYTESAEANPLGVYGRSKLAGERLLLEILPLGSAIVRTSWLYSEHGNNFVKTMLRLMAEREQVSVVNDQIGSPTSTHSLATLLLTMAQTQFQRGIFHWTDGGAISWYDFAVRIQQEALQHNLLSTQIPVKPISTAEYPTAARRPAYSVLDRRRTLSRFTCPGLTWEQQLRHVIVELARQKLVVHSEPRN